MKIGFVNGCFDVLHTGHMALLDFARQNCDWLIVAVNSDRSVRELKGEGRPIQPLQLRMESIKNYLMSASVIPFEGRPNNLIMELRPDVIFIGYDHYKGESDLVLRGIGWKSGAPIIKIRAMGGPYVEGISTTKAVKEKT